MCAYMHVNMCVSVYMCMNVYTCFTYVKCVYIHVCIYVHVCECVLYACMWMCVSVCACAHPAPSLDELYIDRLQHVVPFLDISIGAFLFLVNLNLSWWSICVRSHSYSLSPSPSFFPLPPRVCREKSSMTQDNGRYMVFGFRPRGVQSQLCHSLGIWPWPAA